MIRKERLLERFLRYVRVYTTADDNSTTYPSSKGQLELGAMLAAELKEMGAADVEHDSNGLVWATIPANSPKQTPAIAFNAHVDTSPETTGLNVKPQIIKDYQGGDIVLPGDTSKVIRVTQSPELNELIGKTIITTDGTTLLGGDDKAGVAIMMELGATLLEHPEIKHGPVRLLFTCDEEIGHGIDHVDLKKLGATACYTLDGGGQDGIDVETFSADLAIVTVRGVNIHPSIAKGRMVNSIRAAGDFLARMPKDLSPEQTDGRDGFLHPYVLEGGVAATTIKVLLRSFDTPVLREYEALLKKLAKEVEQSWPGIEIQVECKKQYRNMRDGLHVEPRAVEFAVEALKRIGRTPKLEIIRGGTDGSQLTERGLPTPNLASGQHNPHSPLEFACLDEMLAAAEHALSIVQVWHDRG